MLDRIVSQTNQAVSGFLGDTWEAAEEVAEAAAQGAQDVIDLAGPDVSKAVEEGGDAVVDALTAPSQAVEGAIESTFTNLFAGRIANALEAPTQALDAIVFGIPRRIVTGLFDVQGRLLDAGSRLLGPLGEPVRDLGHRALDIGRAAVMTVGESVRDVLRIPFEIFHGVIRHGENAVKLAMAGHGWGVVSELLQMGVQPFRTVIGTAVDIHIRVAHVAVSSIGTIVGRPPSRGLTPDEKALLERVYGDSIDVDSIRVRRGDLSHGLGIRTHAVGNTIYMEEKYFNPDGTLTQDGLQVLVHEASHISQSQNSGGDYMHTAIVSQALAAVGSVLRGDPQVSDHDAYDWRTAVNSGVPYDAMTPEQQAHLAEEIGLAMLNDADGVLTIDDFTHDRDDGSPAALTPAEFAAVMRAWEEIRAGVGAV